MPALRAGVSETHRPDQDPVKPLHPLPKGLVELYGLLAVLMVLVPEWLADGALAGLPNSDKRDMLPAASVAWRRVPELLLASMSLMELRQLAQALHQRGYSAMAREQLSAVLLKRLKRRQ